MKRAERMPNHAVLALALVATLVPRARAQMGTVVAGPIDAQTATGNSTLTSVTYGPGGYLLTGGAATPGGQARYYETSLSVGSVRLFLHCPAGPPDTSNSDWTFYESTQYSAGCYLSARTGQFCCYEKVDGGYVCTPGPIAPIAASSLAAEPSSGHLYVADGTSAIREITVDFQAQTVTVLRVLPSIGKDIRGFAWDPVNNMLWASCANSPAPGQVEFVQIDPQSGQATGVAFPGIVLPPPNVPGGADIYFDYRNPGKLSLVTLHRSTPTMLVVYDLGVPTVCTGYPTVYCTPKTNSLGCLPTMGFTGSPSASATSGFTVRATHVLNQKAGLLFYSLTNRDGTPFQGGFRCAAPPVKRTPQTNSGGGPPNVNDCSGVYAIDMNTFAAGLGGGNPDPALALAGSVVRCQWWGRDPQAPPHNTTLSNGLEYVICP